METAGHHPDDDRLWLERVHEEVQQELGENEERRLLLDQVTADLTARLADAIDTRQALAEELDAIHRTRAWKVVAQLRRFKPRALNRKVDSALTVTELATEPVAGGPQSAEIAPPETVPSYEDLPLKAAPRRPHPPPSVSIVIPTRDSPDLLAGVLQAVAVADWPDLETILVDNGTVDPKALALLATSGHTVVRDEQPFNFPALIQRGVDASRGEILILLNNDIVTADPDWVAALVECLMEPGCGIAGALLLTDDGAIQHSGLAFSDEQPVHALAGEQLADVPIDLIAGIQPRTAVTGACLAIRRSTWEALGGMDPLFTHNYNDVDLCLRAGAEGLGVLCTSKAKITHLESATRGFTWSKQGAADWLLFRARWRDHLARTDPYLPCPRGAGKGD